ncbi:MAG: hypothetical protein NTV94_15260, partial [Planctomycetota bacterium]|nr:hypothetical protein [Planctomycetota bacterium]
MRYHFLLLAALPFLSGCVFSDIRDQVVVANTGLTKVDTQLGETNKRLTEVETGLARLDKTNDLIGNVESGLGRIDRTNDSLTLLERQLNTLDSMNKSMVRLDQHLAGLRKSLNSIDSLLPFLDMGSGDVTEPSAAAVADASSSAAAPADAGTATTTDPAASTAKNRPDPLVGVWIAEFPARDHAFVLLANGTVVRAEAGKPLARGTWKKEGEEYVFTIEARKVVTPEGTAATPTSGAAAA